MPRAEPGSFDLAALFRALERARGVVLAVSGGPDSTALMHLVSRWRVDHPAMPISVASVDHGLRDGSAREAQAVAAVASGLGFEVRILTWQGPKPGCAIQERAREARYDLLVGFANEIGATHLVTAHTLDDQAETLLFRMARGSGLAGLGGMRSVGERDGISHIRPFLTVRKQVLVDLCAVQGWPVLNDPANADPRFARTRWRALGPALAAEGLTPERLGALALRLARAEAALCRSAESVAAACVLDGHSLPRRFRAEALLGHPVELVSRIIGSAVVDLTGEGRMRLNRLEHLVDDLVACHARRATLRRTLHNCLISLDHQGVLTIEPEGRRQRGMRPGSGSSITLTAKSSD